MITSRKLTDLLPEVAMKARAFIDACTAEGIDVLITSTYRDNESQNLLYAQGRTMPGRIVTNAKGGQSFHNYQLAFDFVPLRDGKPQWEDENLFEKCGLLGESVGLEWAGRWTRFRELAHLQYSGGLTVAQLAVGMRPVFDAC